MSKDLKRKKADPVYNRKTLDRAFILPLIGLVLLISPLAKIFQIDILIAGVPFTIVYLFVVWGLLIAGAAYLSKRLRNHLVNNESDNVQEELDQ